MEPTFKHQPISETPGRSMFDVQSFQRSKQKKFHTSAALAASAQSDQKRNFVVS
jgi:hypothetical protein